MSDEMTRHSVMLDAAHRSGAGEVERGAVANAGFPAAVASAVSGPTGRRAAR